MSITIENPEAEALLADLAAQTHRSPADLVLALLQRERERIATERTREDDAAIASGRRLHERTYASPLVDPRPIDEILSYDENGLPM